MAKPKIKKLKYPLWFNITFYILTIILPIVLVMIEGYKSPSKTFRWTFGIITGLIIIYTFVKKFILKGKIKNLQDKKVKLEHEYEIELGNLDKVQYLWYTNEQFLSVINALEVLLYGGLLGILAYGAAEGLFTIKALTCMVALCYIIAYIIKFTYITILKEKQYKENKEDEVNERKETDGEGPKETI